MEVLICPFCKNPARWGDSLPDEDGDMHECEHVVCDRCQISVALTGNGHEGCETYAEAKQKMAALFRLRPSI